MKIVLYGKMIAESAERLKNHLILPSEIEIFSEGTEDHDFLDQCVKEADVLVSMKFKSQWENNPQLKLLQIPGVGTDLISLSHVPKQAKICLTYGHEASVSEHVIYGLLAFYHNFRETEGSFRRRNWEMSSRASGPFHDQLSDKTIGLLGYGMIGKALVKRLKVMGCQIHVSNRSHPQNDELINKFWKLDEIHEMVREVDALVVCIAHAPETDRIIDASVISAMKPNILFINVARGACVDEDALYDALKTEKISGAIIDTWWKYPSAEYQNPLPGKHNWLALPNTIVTPHTSAWSKQMWDVRIRDIASNINALCNNTPLKNELKRG